MPSAKRRKIQVGLSHFFSAEAGVAARPLAVLEAVEPRPRLSRISVQEQLKQTQAQLKRLEEQLSQFSGQPTPEVLCAGEQHGQNSLVLASADPQNFCTPPLKRFRNGRPASQEFLSPVSVTPKTSDRRLSGEAILRRDFPATAKL